MSSSKLPKASRSHVRWVLYFMYEGTEYLAASTLATIRIQKSSKEAILIPGSKASSQEIRQNFEGIFRNRKWWTLALLQVRYGVPS